MLLGKPSRTALAAASHRAAHQVLEQGQIFTDPLALRILGEDAEAALERAAEPSSRKMRFFIAVRTRFAEDALTAAIARGVHQAVILGAGLDTFAYRTTLSPPLRIFEVDHPATQAWKRQRLEEAGISVPEFLTFAPVDFERETLAQGLAAAGFDPTRQTFFTWLGVVPYLTGEAIWSTLALITSLPNGAHVVFDYSDPPETLPPELRAAHDRRAARVAALGESFVSFFEPEDLHFKLRGLGFSEVEDLGPPQIVSSYFPGATRPAPARGGHIIRATTIARASAIRP